MKTNSVVIAALVIAIFSVSAYSQVRLAQRVNPGGFNNNGNNAQDGITVASGPGRFVAVWAEQAATSASTQDIWAAVSEDEGLSFLPPTRVDLGDAPNAADSDFPKAVITADGTIVVVWQETRGAVAFGSSNQDVYMNRSIDGGRTWQATSVPLNLATSGSHVTSDVDRVLIASSGNDVYVVWEEDSVSGIGKAEELWLTKSGDAGQTWSPPIILGTLVPGHSTQGWTNQDVDDPKIVADGQTVIVAMADDRIRLGGVNQNDTWVIVSTDGGANWNEIVLDSGQPGQSSNVQVALAGSLACVIWEDNVASLDALHASVSQDGGVSWSPEFTVSPAQEAVAASQAFRGQVAIEGDNIYIAYVTDHLSVLGGGPTGQAGSKAYVAVSNNRGASWVFDLALDAANVRRNNRTAVAAANGVVSVHLETGVDGANRVGYCWSTDFGLSWSPVVEVGNTGPDTDTSDPNEGAYLAVDPVSGAAVSVYHDRPLGQNEAYASGVRAPWVALDGTPSTGSVVHFRLSGVPVTAIATGTAVIGVSVTGTGPTLLGGNAPLLHLDIDALTLLLISDPSLLPIVTGPIDFFGNATMASFPWPGPPGMVVHVAGLVVLPSGFLATDPLSITGL